MNISVISRNEKTAEFVGLMFGDGGLTLRKDTPRLRLQLRGSLIEDKEHYDQYIIPLFNQEIMFPLFNRNVGVVFNKNCGFYGISAESKKLQIINESLNIPIGPKKELNIPDWILKDKKNMFGFLRGFLDTDGSIYCERNYSVKNNEFHNQIKINFCCCSRNLMIQISEIIKNQMGIKNQLKRCKHKNNNWKDWFVVKINGNINVKKWFKEIGSKNPKHVTKFLVWKKFGFCPPHTTLEERKKILKGEKNPLSYYRRKCRSGQTGQKDL